MGEKLFEEKGKMTMGSVTGIDADGITLLQFSNCEIKGMGRFPSG